MKLLTDYWASAASTTGFNILPWQRTVLNSIITARAQGMRRLFVIPARGGRGRSSQVKQELERIFGETRGEVP